MLEQLAPLLSEAVLAYVDEHNRLPVPSYVSVGAPAVPLPRLPFQEEASEKFLDFAKAEFDRVSASSKLAEERAKQNGVYALAAVPILSFIRPEDPALWYVIGQIGCVVLIVATLLSVGRTLRPVTLRGIGWTQAEMDAEQEVLLRGYRPYSDLLYLLQGAWISGGAAMKVTRDARFAEVERQQWFLLPLAVLIMALLIAPPLAALF
ncbi:hypothetical protein GCM10008959_25740 [Deinococcus seoulensis]|uniref:Yip1 domain-containing protein n=1 Tax=Deinococcus seoulensis TaxID=1837379 RepID=A0ABQ2RSC5_9DEIO|nr:hypothetical protein [Deinococcus seoulensis]GGR62569.1 hypothetical protein GCM10008959_25740 [Deinococcus seoulensis]